MKLWFARDKQISIRDQLTTQLMLGIVTGELKAGERLPSTRALARRYRLHCNTVSAAYRQLEQQHWVKSIRGSGVYVGGGGETAPQALRETFDRLALQFVRSARRLGVSAAEVRQHLDTLLTKRARRFVFAHDDATLRQIVCAELNEQICFEATGCDLQHIPLEEPDTQAVFLTVPSQEARVAALLPRGAELMTLRVTGIAGELAKYMPYRTEVLTIVASRWERFLEIARTMLTAAGYSEEELIFRDAGERDWKRGLLSGSVIVCDSVTSMEVPEGFRKIVFRLVSEECIAELKAYEWFLGLEAV